MSEKRYCTVVVYSFTRAGVSGNGRIVIYNPQRIESVQQLFAVENWIKKEEGFDSVFATSLMPMEDIQPVSDPTPT